MRAVKLTSPSTVTLEETPVPEPGPGEIRVKVAGAGLCHSDLHLIGMGDAWPAFGITLGHEGAGYVDALGSGVTKRVSHSPQRTCSKPATTKAGRASWLPQAGHDRAG